MDTPPRMTAREAWAAILEVSLLGLLSSALYLSAFVAFPIFHYEHGLIYLLDGTASLPFRLIDWVPVSSALFALTGALMIRWLPAMPPPQIAWSWVGAYGIYGIDASLGYALTSRDWDPLVSLGAGAIFLLVFFKLLEWAGPPERPLYQPATWRSRFAGVWLLTWMAFWVGLSALVLSTLTTFSWARLTLGLGVLGLAFRFYSLQLALRHVEGRETTGTRNGLYGLLGVWAMASAALTVVRMTLHF